MLIASPSPSCPVAVASFYHCDRASAMSQDPSSFTPSHQTPAGGIPAWDRPDATLPPTLTLASAVPLEVLHWQADGWWQVRAATGWTGWIDGRLLTAVPPTAAAATRANPLALIGGAVVLLGSFLPWFTYQGHSASAWKTPLLFLLAGTGHADEAKVGPVLIVMVLVALPLVSGRRLPTWAGWGLAGIASAVGGMALAHGVFGTDPPSIGVGVVATLAGGLLLSMATTDGQAP